MSTAPAPKIMSRPVSSFREFPVVNAAYGQVRERLLLLVRDGIHPELGRIVVPAWVYMHACVPKQFKLPSLPRSTNWIGWHCANMILPLLRSGELQPEKYAALITDPVRFTGFLKQWLSRPLAGRALGKTRTLKHAMTNRWSGLENQSSSN